MRSVLQLHRAAQTSDWEDISQKNRNNWQILAAKTHGIITPGNLITLAGAIIVIIGLVSLSSQSSWVGVILILIGRLADIADGYVADKTRTKSSLGEAFDAGIDKVLALATVVVFVIHDLVPLIVLLLFAAHSVLNSIVSVYYKFNNRSPHPTISGKLATAFIWLSLVGFLLTDIYAGSIENALNLLSWLAFGAFIILGAVSSYSYIKQGRA